MNRMLINATQREELRVALVDGQRLYDLDIESPGREQRKSNIYKGRITRIEPSLEAAFVDYGADRQGFLPFKEVAREYFSESAQEKGGRATIAEALREGQELVVEIEKEERGNKGAALTTFVSLAGRYLVLMPNNPRAGGVSRRVEGKDRTEMREALSGLEVPAGMGLIVRTAGVGRQVEELQWDLNYLLHLWDAISRSAEARPAPFLIFQDSNIIIRAIRDYLRPDINEIIVDNERVHEQARGFMQQVMPENLRRLKLYTDRVPLFSRYQIESQIESAFTREVKLPSGGSISIDHSEALTAIDVNSARATKGADIEDTALNTNLEAVDELARQLRIRDLGGLIVIDFIDMGPSKNQRKVENRMHEALKMDRARVQLGRISRFGLMEMSRQRLRPSLGESSHMVCPRCSGCGSVRTVHSLALSILRLLEEEAMKDGTARVVAQTPVDVATFLLNEKRRAIEEVQTRNDVTIVVVPNMNLETPHYSIERVRRADVSEETERPVSYEMVEAVEESAETGEPRMRAPDEPAVRAIDRPPPAPARQPAPPSDAEMSATTAAVAAAAPAVNNGLLRRVWRALVGTGENAVPASAANDAPGESAPVAAPVNPPEAAPANTAGAAQPRQPGRGNDGRSRHERGRGQRREGGERRDGRRDGGQNRDRGERPQRSESTERPEQNEPRNRQDGQSRDPNRQRSRRGQRSRNSGEPGTTPSTDATAPTGAEPTSPPTASPAAGDAADTSDNPAAGGEAQTRDNNGGDGTERPRRQHQQRPPKERAPRDASDPSAPPSQPPAQHGGNGAGEGPAHSAPETPAPRPAESAAAPAPQPTEARPAAEPKPEPARTPAPEVRPEPARAPATTDGGQGTGE